MMIIAPVDYFWYFLKDGRLASKAATFLTFYFLFFYLVFFMQDVACGLAICFCGF